MSLFTAILFQLMVACWANEMTMTFKDKAIRLSDIVRTSVRNAREGMLLSAMSQRIAFIEDEALPFLSDEDAAKSQCETNTILKMAAASTRSREVLSVLFANDTYSLQSGLLTLAWSVLDNVNQQLIEELAVSENIQPHVAALSIVAQTAQTIIQVADKTLSALSSDVKLDDHFYREEGGLAWRERASFLQFDLSPLQQIKRRRSAPLPLERQRRCSGGSRCWIGVGF